MRILVISQYFYPEQFRINEIVTKLVQMKNEVTVVTGLPNYPEGEVYEGYEKSYGILLEYNGARLYRCKLRPRHKGVKNLALNYLSFVLEANKILKKLEPTFDVIYVYEPSPVTVAIPAIWYKRKHKIPIYYYCMDIWPECVRDAQNGRRLMSKRHPIYIAAKLISKYVYKHVDLIGNKCSGFFDYIHDECGIDKSKMRLLYEHAEDIYCSNSSEPINNDIVDFMFLGNIGKAQNCDMFIKAMSEITPIDKCRLHFVGDGSEANNLKRLVKQLNLDNTVVFHGHHSLMEIMKYYEVADCCLLSLSGDTASGITPPGKLYGYMAASRAIIAAIGGDAKPIIEAADCGWCVPADDYRGLVTLMQSAVDGECNLIQKGKNGRAYFMDNFTLDKHIEELLQQLKELV